MMDVLNFTEDDVCRIRKYYHIDASTVKLDIAILRNWIRQQRHLPQNQDDNFLEHCLLRNKFRVEDTKAKIDAYYKLRGVHRQFYQPNNVEFHPSKEVVVGLPLPVLTPALERILLVKFANCDPHVYDLIRVSKFFALLLEILIRSDYSIGEKLILDCRGATVEHLKKISPKTLSDIYTLYQGAYSGHPVSIDIINAPTYINVILGWAKMIFSPKIYAKIQVHNDLASLHRSCPPKCLPREYGGDLDTTSILIAKWDGIFEENRPFFNANFTNVADEEMRIAKLQHNHLFGVDGTFKQLNLD